MTDKDIPEDPLDITLGQMFGVVESGSPDFPDDLGHSMEGREMIKEAFGKLHPANAGLLIRLITDGLDEGYTAQGGYHPDFQTGVKYARRNPEDRFRD